MHGVERALADGASFIADLSDEERFRLIAVPAIHNTGDIDIDDIAILENVVAGDPMADDVVDAGADGGGIAVVVEGGRFGAEGEGAVVDGVVEIHGRDTGLD